MAPDSWLLVCFHVAGSVQLPIMQRWLQTAQVQIMCKCIRFVCPPMTRLKMIQQDCFIVHDGPGPESGGKQGRDIHADSASSGVIGVMMMLV